jgi:NADH:ubiquinone oxidoreductase subunit F (NADH-binding)/NADH:ubiquinone oxidoreductase subunit E
VSDRRQATVELERRYGRRASEVLRLLRDAKRERGRLSEDEVDGVAATVGLPRAHVHGAASFFADLGFEPQRDRHVRVCAGTACFAATGDAHLEACESAAERLGASTQRVRCLGCCYTAPALLDGEEIRAGDDLAGRLAAGDSGAPPIPFQSAVEAPVLLARLCGGGVDPWSVFGTAPDAEGVIREVEASGLRGRGGAAFPVARKWAAARAHPREQRYVVCNGDEGDPGSYVDRLLMERDPHAVLEGVALAALAVGAERAWVYVRSEYPRARESLRAAVKEARDNGYLGRAGGVDIEIFEGAGSYVAGEETALLHSMEGLRGAAAARPPFPADEGLYGRPTVINNVETLSAVPWIVAHGGAAYAARGTDQSHGTKLVCLNERFARPGVYEIELGTSVRAICEELGGGLRDGHELRCLQVGGPLGGFLGPGDLDVPMSFEGLRAVGVELGHGGLVAFDERISGAELLRHVWGFAAEESCGTCFPCRVGSRRGLELAERLAGGELDVAARLEPILDVMETASLCGFGQGVPAPVRQLLRIYRDELGARA